MFEWLKGTFLTYKSMDCFIKSFNKESGMFIIVDEESSKEFEISLEEAIFNFHFTYIEGWESKLYKKLISTNELYFFFNSLESYDSWDFNIKRTEARLTNDLVLVNYVIVFCDEIQGEVFSTQSNLESEDKFVEWLERQMEEITLFNNRLTCAYRTMDGISTEESFASIEELNYILESLS